MPNPAGPADRYDPFMGSQWTGSPSKHPALGNFTSSTQRNPDFDQLKGRAGQWYGEVDPETRRRQAMSAARELGVGLGKEAAASRTRRGVSGTGVDSYDQRNIAGTVMREANKAGLAAADKGQELQLGGINAMTNIASGQSGAMQKDLDRQLAAYQARQQALMDEQRLKLEKMRTLMDAAKSGLGDVGFGAASSSRGGGIASGGIGKSSRSGGGGWG